MTSELTLRTDDVLVFIDETGDENISKGYRLFGLGGVIIYGADYEKHLVTPWTELRATLGIPSGRPLHASGSRRIYSAHLDALANFFRKNMFVRHAAIVTDDTNTNMNAFVATACGGLFRNVGRALARVERNSPVGRVVYIVEHSVRLKAQYERLAGPNGPVLIDGVGRRRCFPHDWISMTKEQCESGLEVSDFVLHAAQGHVRAKRNPLRSDTRSDFECVFRQVPRQIVEYMELRQVDAEPAKGEAGVFYIPLR